MQDRGQTVSNRIGVTKELLAKLYKNARISQLTDSKATNIFGALACKAEHFIEGAVSFEGR